LRQCMFVCCVCCMLCW